MFRNRSTLHIKWVLDAKEIKKKTIILVMFFSFCKIHLFVRCTGCDRQLLWFALHILTSALVLDSIKMLADV